MHCSIIALHVTASLNVAAHDAAWKRLIFVMWQFRHCLRSLTDEREGPCMLVKNELLQFCFECVFNYSNSEKYVICGNLSFTAWTHDQILTRRAGPVGRWALIVHHIISDPLHQRYSHPTAWSRPFTGLINLLKQWSLKNNMNLLLKSALLFNINACYWSHCKRFIHAYFFTSKFLIKIS